MKKFLGWVSVFWLWVTTTPKMPDLDDDYDARQW
jgi:hypothetical protein